MDRDGTKAGYDLDLLEAISATAAIPLIASGGAGTLQHLADSLAPGRADAALGGLDLPLRRVPHCRRQSVSRQSGNSGSDLMHLSDDAIAETSANLRFRRFWFSPGSGPGFDHECCADDRIHESGRVRSDPEDRTRPFLQSVSRSPLAKGRAFGQHPDRRKRRLSTARRTPFFSRLYRKARSVMMAIHPVSTEKSRTMGRPRSFSIAGSIPSWCMARIRRSSRTGGTRISICGTTWLRLTPRPPIFCRIPAHPCATESATKSRRSPASCAGIMSTIQPRG